MTLRGYTLSHLHGAISVLPIAVITPTLNPETAQILTTFKSWFTWEDRDGRYAESLPTRVYQQPGFDRAAARGSKLTDRSQGDVDQVM